MSEYKAKEQSLDLDALAWQTLKDLENQDVTSKKFILQLALRSAYEAGRDHGWWQSRDPHESNEPMDLDENWRQ